MAGLGFRRSAVFGRGRAVGYRWARPGPPPDLSKVQRPAWLPPDGDLGVAVGTRVVRSSGPRPVSHPRRLRSTPRQSAAPVSAATSSGAA